MGCIFQRVLYILTFCFSFLLLGCGTKHQDRDVYFDDEYPPVKNITYTESGKEYEVLAITGHAIIFFKDGVTQPQAKDVIKKHGGKIIEQMPSFNYYLVKVAVGKESAFVYKMRQESAVEHVGLNGINIPQAEVYILDHFKDVDPDMLTTHGNGAIRIFLKYAGNKNDIHNINRRDMNLVTAETTAGQMWEALTVMVTANSLCTDLLNIAQESDINNLILVNMSFGVGLPKDRVHELFADVSAEAQINYAMAYQAGLKTLAQCFQKMNTKGFSNFIVTKSSGNEGMYNLQGIISMLSADNLHSLQRNMVLVNAYDKKNGYFVFK